MRKLILIILILGGIAVIASNSKNTPAPSFVPPSSTVVPPSTDVHAEGRRLAPYLVSIKNFSWSKGGFGTVMQASFTFDNKSDYDIKDIVVRCTLNAPSGTTIDTSTRTIYERVPARSAKAIKDFNMGFIHSQAARSGCDVVTAVAADFSAPPAKPAPKTSGSAKP